MGPVTTNDGHRRLKKAGLPGLSLKTSPVALCGFTPRGCGQFIRDWDGAPAQGLHPSHMFAEGYAQQCNPLFAVPSTLVPMLPSVPMPSIFVILPPMATAIVMIFAIAGHIHIAIPILMDEIDRPAAGVILMTIPVPSFHVTGRNVEIERRAPNRGALYNHRLFVDHSWWWVPADIDAAKESRFRHADRHSGVRLPRCDGKQGCQDCSCC